MLMHSFPCEARREADTCKYHPTSVVPVYMPLQLPNWLVPARPASHLQHLDWTRWLKGRQARSFVGFLLALNEAVRGKRLGDECLVSPAAEALLKVSLKRCAAQVDVTAASILRSLKDQYKLFGQWPELSGCERSA